MHFVIMGCGRVGSTLAQSLEDHGHTVAVIDQNPDAFRRLGAGFDGRRVTGLGFDRDTLREAGIEEAVAFAAVSSGDNSNILAARVARETFGVENVVARIYDPGRAEVYQRLGIPTVATVPLDRRPDAAPAAARGRRRRECRDPSGKVVTRRGARAPGLGRAGGERRSRRPTGAPGGVPHPARARDCCRRRHRPARRATSCTS